MIFRARESATRQESPTDGPANGGDFAAKTVDIEFTEAERTAKGDGDWDQGAFAKSGVDIALEEKE